MSSVKIFFFKKNFFFYFVKSRNRSWSPATARDAISINERRRALATSPFLRHNVLQHIAQLNGHFGMTTAVGHLDFFSKMF